MSTAMERMVGLGLAIAVAAEIILGLAAEVFLAW